MNTEFKKILISENKFLISEMLEYEKTKIERAKGFPPMVRQFLPSLETSEIMGLSWQALEAKIKDTFQFPMATEEHNLNCLGLTKSYAELKEYHRINQWAFDAAPLTPERIEALTESNRTYTVNATQNEVHALVNTVAKSLNRLSQLGLNIDVNRVHTVCPLFQGDHRRPEPLEINQVVLLASILKLK